jgi:opacity protein-like surface antigen
MRRRYGCVAVGTVLISLSLCRVCSSADADAHRFYAHLRYSESLPFTRAHDGFGASLGVNLNRYLSTELSFDHYDLHLTLDGVGKVAELGTGIIMPTVRLRYPLLHDKLEPYLTAGAGVAFSQINDRTTRALGRPIQSDDVAFAGAVGGGLDYTWADNFQIGLAGKYLMTTNSDTTVSGTNVNSDLNAALLSFSFRLLYPALHPEQESGSGSDGAYAVYFAVRAGGAAPVHHHVFGQVVEHETNAAIGPTFNQMYGVAFGLNLGPNLGVEMPIGGYEMALGLPGVGTIGEYAVYDLIPRVRVRYPLRGGLETYIAGGVGPTYAEFNDRRPITKGLGKIRGKGFGFGGLFGGGLEYFLMRNVSVAAEATYFMDRSHELRIEDVTHSGNLDSIFLNLQLKVMLFNSGARVPSWLTF